MNYAETEKGKAYQSEADQREAKNDDWNSTCYSYLWLIFPKNYLLSNRTFASLVYVDIQLPKRINIYWNLAFFPVQLDPHSKEFFIVFNDHHKPA